MFKIAYCAGHHLGNPKGVPTYMGLGDIREWTLNDRVAYHFARAALEYEDVEILRTDDATGKNLIDIPDRCAKANNWGADLYVDMHHNGGINGGTGGGVVAFCYPGSENGKKYRDAIDAAVIAAGGLKGNRAQPLQEQKYDSLRLSHMAAVLVEYGFMDSRTDAPVIITDAYSKLVAYATMEGIAKVADLKKKEYLKETVPAVKTAELSLPVLSNGSEGNAVRTLQILLKAYGYDCGIADGIFGSKTDAAVRAYQKDHSLTTDGIAGKATWTSLLGL